MTNYSDLKFDWFSEISAIAGYGLQSRRVLKPLIEGGADIKIIPDEDYLPPHMKISDPFWEEQIKLSKDKPDNDLRIAYCLPNRARFSDKNKIKILHAMWETDQYPREWAGIINGASNYFFAGCDNLVDSAIKAGVQVPVMPLYATLDTDSWNPEGSKLSIAEIPDNYVKFLFIGNFIPRKNLEQLVAGFTCAFSDTKDVALVIKTWAQANSADGKKHICDAIRMFQNKITGIGKPKICVITDLIEEEKMIELIRSCDVYTTVSKGEGFDLPMMQSMAMEKLIVTTRFLAHADYLNDSNSINVPFTLQPCQDSGAPLYDSYQFWSSPDMKGYIEALRAAYDMVKSGTGKPLQQAARNTIIEKYGKENNTERIAQLIRDVQAGKYEKKESSKILIKDLV